MVQEYWGQIHKAGVTGPVGGGFNDATINMTFSLGRVFDPNPVKLVGMFTHGTTAGSWNESFDRSFMTTLDHGTWQVTVTGTISGEGELSIFIETGFDPATQVLIFHETVDPVVPSPLSYTGTFTDPGAIALPMYQPSFLGTFQTINATVTFTYIP